MSAHPTSLRNQNWDNRQPPLPVIEGHSGRTKSVHSDVLTKRESSCAALSELWNEDTSFPNSGALPLPLFAFCFLFSTLPVIKIPQVLGLSHQTFCWARPVAGHWGIVTRKYIDCLWEWTKLPALIGGEESQLVV
jgi:hypothetical protein